MARSQSIIERMYVSMAYIVGIYTTVLELLREFPSIDGHHAAMQAEHLKTFARKNEYTI